MRPGAGKVRRSIAEGNNIRNKIFFVEETVESSLFKKATATWFDVGGKAKQEVGLGWALKKGE